VHDRGNGSQTEVTGSVEAEGSRPGRRVRGGRRVGIGVGWRREDGWRHGPPEIAFGLLGLKELDTDRNELLREQNEL